MKSFIKQLSRAIEEKDTTQVKVVLQYHTANLMKMGGHYCKNVAVKVL